MLTFAGLNRGADSRSFRHYAKAADWYVNRVCLPVFIGSSAVMLIGGLTGTVPYRGRVFEMASAVLLLIMASWCGVNGLAVAWGAAVGLRATPRQGVGALLFSLLLCLVSAVFLYGAYVSTWASAAAWARAI